MNTGVNQYNRMVTRLAPPTVTQHNIPFHPPTHSPNLFPPAPPLIYAFNTALLPTHDTGYVQSLGSQIWLRSVGIVQPQAPTLYMPNTDQWGSPQYTLVQSPRVSIWRGLALFGAAILGSIVIGKACQAATDTVYGSRCYPAPVRRDLISDHIERHGQFCTSCGRYTTQWAIDHRHPWSRGGLTSLANAQVLCVPCNASKSANFNVLDALLGRSNLGSFISTLFGFR